MEVKVVIVGAGLSGLLACKHIVDIGLNPIVLEAEERLGGVWRHTLQSTKLQDTKSIYTFSDFPWPSDLTDDHPTHDQVLEYFESYAKHFNIYPCIKFNSKVTGIDYVGEPYETMQSWNLWNGATSHPFHSKGKWVVKVQDTKSLKMQVYHAKFLILGIGQYSGFPNVPEFPQNQGPEVFKGQVIHSEDFSKLGKSAAELIKTKKVAIIGSHKSAVDIAAECAQINGVKYPCTIVQRNAHWFVSGDKLCGLLFGYLFFSRFSELLHHKPGESFLLAILATLLRPLRWAISKFFEAYLRRTIPLEKCGMLPEVSFSEDVSSCQLAVLPGKFCEKVDEGSIAIKKSKSFSFCSEGLITDGETGPLKADTVILTTGYRGEEKLISIFESQIFKGLIEGSPTDPIVLYRQVIHPRIPQLAVVGFNRSKSNLYSFQMQSIWLAHFLSGSINLSCIRDMEKEVKLWKDHIKQVSGRYFRRGCIGNLNIWYNDQICRDIGCNPRRKNGFLANWLVPYGPTDYAGLISDYQMIRRRKDLSKKAPTNEI